MYQVKERVKATLTVHARGTSGGEGPRTHVQVFANSLTATLLALLHTYHLGRDAAAASSPSCFSCGSGSGGGADLLVVGIIANYACVAADTFSSELGILSRSPPRLITSPTLRRVPPGTNGGVTAVGLAAGLLGSMVMVTAAVLTLPFCSVPATDPDSRRALLVGLTAWGLLGSLVDSLLGGLFQATVRDVRSGKVVEGEGGVRVLVHPTMHAAIDDNNNNKNEKEKPSRVVENGWDLLDNNDVNFLMAFGMSLGAMAVASWYWGVPLRSILPSAPAA